MNGNGVRRVSGAGGDEMNAPKSFNDAIRRLQILKDQRKRGSREWSDLVEIANRLNPGRTPIGFYLD